jgi:hypothetical protein
MFAWVALIALGCSFGTGWALSGLFCQRRVYRSFISPLLGLGLTTSLFCLGDLFLSPVINVLFTFVLVGATGFVSLKSPVLDKALELPLTRMTGGLVAGLLATAWIFAVGSVQLFPDLEFILWDLTQATPGQRSPLMAAASLFGPDPWLGVQLLCGLTQVAVVLGAFGLARVVSPDSKLSWPIVGLYLLGATESGWLTFHKPEEVLIHLWGLGVFLVFQLKGPNRHMLAVPMLTALGLVCWPLALGLILTLPSWRRMLVLFALVGVAQNLFFHGYSMGLGIAAVMVLYQYQLPDVFSKATISLCLLELVWGSQGLFGLAALALECGRYLESLWDQSEPGQIRLTTQALSLPSRGLLVVASLLTFWLGVDGAETVVNDVVLIGGQQEEVSHTRLIFPHTLGSWLDWRGSAYGFREIDKNALAEVSALDGNFVYLSGPLPDPRVAAFVAVASGRSLSGWARDSSGPALSRSCALFLFTREPRTLRGTGVPWVVIPGEAPIPTPVEGVASQDFLSVHLEGRKGIPRSMDSLLTAEVEDTQQHEVPAASLIPFELQLHNPTDSDLDLSVYRGVRFAPSYPHRKPLQPIDYPVTPLNLDMLPAHGSLTIVAYLRTGINPLDYSAGLELTRADGTFRPVPMTEPFLIRSWRVELPLDYPFKDDAS